MHKKEEVEKRVEGRISIVYKEICREREGGKYVINSKMPRKRLNLKTKHKPRNSQKTDIIMLIIYIYFVVPRPSPSSSFCST